MPAEPVPPHTSTVVDPPSLEHLLAGISSTTRWAILRELSAGEPLQVIELAERLGRPADSISKHMAVLRKTGLVTQNRAQLYSITSRFLADRTARLVDFGHCLLRF